MLSNNDTGSNDPAKPPLRSGIEDPRKRPASKKAAMSTLDARWRIADGSETLREFTRSGALLAVIGFAMLSRWDPQDVQALVALVLPPLYWLDRGRKGAA